MAVGNIERGQSVDSARECRDRRFVLDQPELVAHAVVGCDIDCGSFRSGAGEQRVDRWRLRIGEHDRAGLRVDRLDLAHAVVFLHRRRQLVLADAVLGVGAERGHRGEAGLDAVAPRQPVDVVAGRLVAHEHAGVDHAPKIFAGLRVDRGVMKIDRRIEVDLRLGDVQKAPRLSFGAFAGLCAGQHVIGRRKDLRPAPEGGPQGAKGFDQGQRGSRHVWG